MSEINELLAVVQTAWPQACVRHGCEGPYICVGNWADIHVSDDDSDVWDVRFHQDPADPTRITSEVAAPDTDGVIALLDDHRISCEQELHGRSTADAYHSSTVIVHDNAEATIRHLAITAEKLADRLTSTAPLINGAKFDTTITDATNLPDWLSGSAPSAKNGTNS